MGGKESAVQFAAAQFAGSSKADGAPFIVPIAKSNMFQPILYLMDSVQSKMCLDKR